MNAAEIPLDRLSPARRPRTKPAGYQHWSDLLFVHWRVPVEHIAPLVPDGLTVDTFQGDAWIGLVAFRMSGVRPRWWPWSFRFPETNVRTYVHRDGRDPGVWFFSLEATNWLAVQVARATWWLNYFHARMSVVREDDRIYYTSRRRGRAGAASELRAVIADRPAETPTGQAEPGTLEHFLIERYLLYTRSSDGRLWRGQVHHAPYFLQSAKLTQIEESLLAASGMIVADAPCHVLYSSEVSVEVFPLVPVAGRLW
jgi:uncharacterized protein